jgi:hypothetical protein
VSIEDLSPATSGSNIYYNSGNVGIGTPNTPARLTLAGGEFFVDNGGVSRYLAFTQKAGRNYGLYFDYNQGSLTTWTDTQPRLTVDNNGNVGIGTTNPSAQLHVQSGNRYAGYFHNTWTLGDSAFGIYSSVGGNGRGYGVYGRSNAWHAYGVYGSAFGYSPSTTYGIYGVSTAGGGWAGYFSGNVNVTGTLTKGGGTFKIDHPLDPTNKYLSHSFVESPDMMNIYNGNITLDAQGEGIVQLPAWFESLNKEFRYQLTCIGGYAPVYIDQEISNNTFRIAGGTPHLKVSWQVTGVRKDAFANAHRVEVEQEKSKDERGKYLYPLEHGMPASMGIDYEKNQLPSERTQR